MKHGALRSNIMLDLEKSVFDLNVAELFSNPIDTKSVYFTLLSRFVSESYSEEELTEIMAKSLLDTLTDINTKLNKFVTKRFNDSVTEIGIIDSLNSIHEIIPPILDIKMLLPFYISLICNKCHRQHTEYIRLDHT